MKDRDLLASVSGWLRFTRQIGATFVPRTEAVRRFLGASETKAPRAPTAGREAPQAAGGPNGPPQNKTGPHAPSRRPGTLAEIRAELGECTRCGLHATRQRIVFGEGPEKARIMVIGEAPGREEDETGRPFVGPSGELLTRMLAAIGLTRNEVFITSVVKCRPPRNRAPEQAEIAACTPFLLDQIRVIAPEFILALGLVAASTLIGRKAPIRSFRGKFHEMNGIKVIVTYHPAYLLRFQGERLLALKREAWQDLQMLQRAHEGS